MIRAAFDRWLLKAMLTMAIVLSGAAMISGCGEETGSDGADTAASSASSAFALNCTVKESVPKSHAANIFSVDSAALGQDKPMPGVQIDIGGETGVPSLQGKSQLNVDKNTGNITMLFEADLSYPTSQRVYKVLGQISLDPKTTAISAYEFNVTGGGFGDEAQTCSG